MELECRVTGLPVTYSAKTARAQLIHSRILQIRHNALDEVIILGHETVEFVCSTGEFVLSLEHIIISNFLYNIMFSNRLC